jgi:hypothetical protein
LNSITSELIQELVIFIFFPDLRGEITMM